MRYRCIFTGHEIVRADGTQSDGVIICPEIADNADGTRIREHGKILIRLDASARNLLAEDGIRITQDPKLFTRDSTDNANGKPRPRERLAFGKIPRQPQLSAERAYLILEKPAQRFDNAGESDILGQPADIMVALYRSRLVAAGFYNIGVNRPLSKESNTVELAGFLLEHADKVFTDYLALLFGISDAGKRFQEACGSINTDKMQIAVFEGCLDLVAFVFAHKTVIDKYAVKPAGNGF